MDGDIHQFDLGIVAHERTAAAIEGDVLDPHALRSVDGQQVAGISRHYCGRGIAGNIQVGTSGHYNVLMAGAGDGDEVRSGGRQGGQRIMNAGEGARSGAGAVHHGAGGESKVGKKKQRTSEQQFIPGKTVHSYPHASEIKFKIWVPELYRSKSYAARE